MLKSCGLRTSLRSSLKDRLRERGWEDTPCEVSPELDKAAMAEVEKTTREYEQEKAAFVAWCEKTAGWFNEDDWTREMNARMDPWNMGRPTEFQCYRRWVQAGCPPLFK